MVGRENIPKKGAVLFAVNHPNGLMDPLMVTTNTPRITHYLVRAAIFKKPMVKKFLATLNLMPIYRIRDGVKELSKNTEVFNDCYDILNQQQALMIFPEGSHDRRRTIRTISKGFTRILFGALEKYPNLKITVIPVGVTYQNSSQFPCKVAIHYGKPILANELYNPKELNKSVNSVKEAVSNQLKKISVHIPLDENYNKVLQRLNNNNIDFTKVTATNQMIQSGNVNAHTSGYNYGKLIKLPFILNSILPWMLWKIISKKIDEIEFVDTFRFGIGISVFPIFYLLQTYIIYTFYGATIASIYFLATLLIALLYSKSAATPTE
ncbi:MAG: 1-acyl-sn-glycerol-3-phosphate acyltransferase [Flavobacteriaceae bacterium]|nr:1-acyl-sn-glycerol-3-phosphate acyltransferase [Flavobacteriaceae bacterium]